MKHLHFLAAVTAVAAMLPAAAQAQPADCQQAPSVLESGDLATASRSIGDIRYVSGGVGSDEAAAMRALRGQFPLSLSFAERSGNRNAFVASVYVTLARADGTPLLCVITSGPYLFFDLPPGTYRVTANAPQRSELTRMVKIVGRQHQDVALLWTTPRPDTGMHAPLVAPPEPVIIRTVVAPPGTAAAAPSAAPESVPTAPAAPEAPAAPAEATAPPAP